MKSLDILELEEKDVSNSTFVCSDHFTRFDYHYYGSRLKNTSVPKKDLAYLDLASYWLFSTEIQDQFQITEDGKYFYICLEDVPDGKEHCCFISLKLIA